MIHLYVGTWIKEILKGAKLLQVFDLRTLSFFFLYMLPFSHLFSSFKLSKYDFLQK